jgi:hypothetical protein
VCPCVEERTAEVGCSGLGPIEASRDGSLQGGLAWRGQGLAQWEHLARIKTEHEPTTAKRDQRSHRRGVILEVSEIRDEPPPRGARLLPKGSGARIDSDGRHLLAKEIGVSVTARRWKWPWVVQARARSAARPKGAKRDHDGEVRGEDCDDGVERTPRRNDHAVPPKQARLREQAGFSSEPEATPANQRERREHGCREVERQTGWHPLVGSV